MSTLFHLRPAVPGDVAAIHQLYMAVKDAENSIARSKTEITPAYIEQYVSKSTASGCIFVAEQDQLIIGEIHAYALELAVFRHVLGELTIAVHPAYQGNGVGRALFTALLAHVQQHRPDILRIELIAKGGDLKAIRFYESLGFVVEGTLRKRANLGDRFESVICMGWLRLT